MTEKSKHAGSAFDSKIKPDSPRFARNQQAVAELVAQIVPAMIASGQLQREYRDHRLEYMLRSGHLQLVVDGLAAGTIRFSREIAG